MNNHIGASSGKVLLSPAAVLILTLALPLVGSWVNDRLHIAASSGSVESDVSNMKQQISSIQETLKTDHVHRTEFSALAASGETKVTKDEFLLLSHDIDARLQQIQSSLDDLKRDQRFARVTVSPKQ